MLSRTGGKRTDGQYCPEDDNALMRLMEILDREGGASLEERLIDAGDSVSGFISLAQFNRFLSHVGVTVMDQTAL